MVGYVVLLISFPVEMTRWVAPLAIQTAEASLSLIDSLTMAFSQRELLDGITAATPLDLVRQNNAVMFEDFMQVTPQAGQWGGLGWEWVNLAFLAGGLLLLYKKIYTWHAPVSMLVSLTLFSMIFYDGGSSNSIGTAQFQLLSGATMLGAWFIVTDPVSSAVSNKGRIIYGALIGALIFTIRKWGNYPDAVAFAVLLANFIAPLLDTYTQPKTYGHQ
jgi:electron transport complex protein RnfD